MKKIIAPASLILFSLQVTAQQYPQLRLRLGATKSIVSQGNSSDNTIYRMYDKRSPIPSGIGLEFSKQMKKHNDNWFAGVFFEFQPFQSGVNPEKFQSLQGGYSSLSNYGCIRFYTGIEKRIGKKEIPASKNYFSVFGGIGISYNGGKQGSASGGASGQGLTNDGRTFTGIYVDRPDPSFSGIMTWETHSRAHVFTPDVFAGFRWNIRNKKGNTVLAVELVANYGLTPKYYHYYNYSLDNIAQRDRLKDKGVNVQVNVLIPLKNFGRKKKK